MFSALTAGATTRRTARRSAARVVEGTAPGVGAVRVVSGGSMAAPPLLVVLDNCKVIGTHTGASKEITYTGLGTHQTKYCACDQRITFTTCISRGQLT